MQGAGRGPGSAAGRRRVEVVNTPATPTSRQLLGDVERRGAAHQDPGPEHLHRHDRLPRRAERSGLPRESARSASPGGSPHTSPRTTRSRAFRSRFSSSIASRSAIRGVPAAAGRDSHDVPRPRPLQRGSTTVSGTLRRRGAGGRGSQRLRACLRGTTRSRASQPVHLPGRDMMPQTNISTLARELLARVARPAHMAPAGPGSPPVSARIFCETTARGRGALVSRVDARDTSVAAAFDPDVEFPSRRTAIQFNHAACVRSRARGRGACRFAEKLTTRGALDWNDWIGKADEVGPRRAAHRGRRSFLDLDRSEHLVRTDPGRFGVPVPGGRRRRDDGLRVSREPGAVGRSWLHGVEVRRRPDARRSVQAADVEAACDATTRLVSVSLVAFHTGFRAQSEELAAFCRARGIVFGLDADPGRRRPARRRHRLGRRLPLGRRPQVDARAGGAGVLFTTPALP